ncbi:MAG TPA: hypothetical protein IAC18_01615 [Candidatus Scatomorpha merdipullorum]|uniref:DUF2007 domain-containing protein n=1 Tax=Candidatus Scatomorpha merdipullorum TaxID=2840927 RepID=A0A9D1FC02_9FIRM|nr:hypothetical protein [Candidatus Scatomorpha merdipullorum]
MSEPKLEWGRGEMPGELAERWPREEDGSYVPAAYLTTCTQLDLGDAILTGVLDSCGIPFFKRFPHYGGFGNLMLGMSAEGVDIYVPETMLDEAKNILEGESEDEEL